MRAGFTGSARSEISALALLENNGGQWKICRAVNTGSTAVRLALLVRKWFFYSKTNTMRVNIQSLGFKAGEELESYIRNKLGKLTPNDHITGANVVLFLGADRATREHFCEIRLEVPGNDHFVKEGSGDFYQAVDEAINKMQGILRKAKEKQVDMWHGRTAH